MADETGAGASAPSAAGSSPAPSTASSSPAASASAPTTAAPAATGPAQESSTGEPPRERWDSILANTRDKTRKEVEAEYRQKYGRFDGFDENPYGFAETLIDQLAAHPTYQPQLLAKAARLLQARRGAASPTVSEEPQPDVPIVDGQGQPTGQATYSAKQLKAWQEWNWTQREQALNDRFSPLEKLSQRIEQAEQQAQITEQAATQSRAVLEDLRQQPHFKEHEAAIKQALLEHEDWGDNVYRAYTHVLTTQVLPTLTKTEQSKVLASLQTQAQGGTVNPGQTAPTQTPKFKDFGEAIRYYEAHPDEAAVMAKR